MGQMITTVCPHPLHDRYKKNNGPIKSWNYCYCFRMSPLSVGRMITTLWPPPEAWARHRCGSRTPNCRWIIFWPGHSAPPLRWVQLIQHSSSSIKFCCIVFLLFFSFSSSSFSSFLFFPSHFFLFHFALFPLLFSLFSSHFLLLSFPLFFLYFFLLFHSFCLSSCSPLSFVFSSSSSFFSLLFSLFSFNFSSSFSSFPILFYSMNHNTITNYNYWLNLQIRILNYCNCYMYMLNLQVKIDFLNHWLLQLQIA